MAIRKLLLGTTALVGAAALGNVALPGVAGAAEVMPGGALDVTLSGFARFRAHGGQLDNQSNTAKLSKFDFSNDTEVHVILRGKHDATGIEYGGTVEFEADTNRLDNSDETWLFVRGGFGEFRFGDEDGAVDNSSIGAYTIAANTGGIDGDVISSVAISSVRPSNTDDSTKIRYYTPSFGGFQFGVSYTPNVAVVNSGAGNGDSIATRDVEATDVVEGALTYKGDFAGLGVQASVVGSWGHIQNADLADGDDKYWTYYGGAATDVFGFKVAGGFGDENVGGLERTYFNAGVGAGFGPVNVSLNYGKVLDSSGYAADKPSIWVAGADVGLMPGLVLGGEVSYVDNDLSGSDQNAGDDKGWAWLANLRLAF